MSIYDKKEFRLHCKSCDTTERVVLFDQGSGWGGADWVTTGSVTRFNVLIVDGEVIKPSIAVQNCKNCGGLDVECAHKANCRAKQPVPALGHLRKEHGADGK